MITARRHVSLVLAAGLAIGAVALGGPLDPPGGEIKSTYKTLTEVEPRIAINSENTPGDPDALFKITQPGSYYLTGNVNGVLGKHGIEIAASGVTLDLMGFDLAGAKGSLDGIVASGGASRLVIVNGNIYNWGGEGIDTFGGGSLNTVVRHINASGNGGSGIALGPSLGGQEALNSVIECTAENNTGDGIFANYDATVMNCTAIGNGQNGIETGTGSTVLGCTSMQNDNDGITVDDGSTISACSSGVNDGRGIFANLGSTVSGCTVWGNLSHGIDGYNGTSVSGCTVKSNKGDGIKVSNNCLVTGNSCSGNGSLAGDGAGIHATSADNRIDGNNVTDNDRGLDVDFAGNLIIRNSASGNTTNYVIVANNKVGPIVVTPDSLAINGDSGGAGVGSTNPWANFSF